MSGALVLQRGPLMQQPQQLPPIDRSNPITRGLVHSWAINAGAPLGVINAASSSNAAFGSGTSGNPSGNQWRIGPNGYYVNFDDSGTGQYISKAIALGNSSGSGSPGSNVFTIHARCRFGSTTTAGSATPNTPDAQTIFGGPNSGAIQFRISVPGAQLQLIKSNVAGVGTSTGTVVAGVDCDLTVTYDGTTAAFYINGQPAGTASSAQTFNLAGQYYAGGQCDASNTPIQEMVANGFRLYALNVWNRVLPANEVAAVSANPWQIFQAPRRRFWLASSSSSAVLVGANATQANSAGTGAASQTHILVGASSSQANTSATGAETQTHVLAGSTSSQANSGGTGAASQTHVLGGAASSQANASAAGAVSQTQVLAGAASAQANTSATGAETQTHVLAGSTSSQANSGAAGAVTQTQVLAGAGSSQANSSGTGALVTSGQLAGAACTQTNGSPGGAVAQTHILAGANAAQSNTSATGAETQRHILGGAPSSQANTSGTAAISTGALPLPAPAEPDRTWSVEGESRTWAVEADNRTWSIAA